MAKTYADTITDKQMLELFRQNGMWNAGRYCYMWDGWECTYYGANGGPFFYDPQGKSATVAEAYAALAQI